MVVLRHGESPDEENRGKSEWNDDDVQTSRRWGVAETRSSMAEWIVVEGKSHFGYTFGYNFKNWHRGSSTGRVISPLNYNENSYMRL